MKRIARQEKLKCRKRNPEQDVNASKHILLKDDMDVVEEDGKGAASEEAVVARKSTACFLTK